MAKDFSKKFYSSKEWKECREAFYVYKHGLCERCGKPGDIVHHKILLTPQNINNPEVTLNWDNLELLCIDCHNKEHISKYGATREDVMFSEDGDLVPSPPIKWNARLSWAPSGGHSKNTQVVSIRPPLLIKKNKYRWWNRVKKELTEKEKNIKKEIARLNKILRDIDKNKRASAEGLIQEAAFMRATLQELKEQINKNGVIDEMPQGEYSILRESPAVKTYNTMIQRYTTVCKELFNLLPKDIPIMEDDGFEEFVNSKWVGR